MENQLVPSGNSQVAANDFYGKIQDPIAAVEKMGQWFHKSLMFGCKTEAQGIVLAMSCYLEKKNPIEICRTFHLMSDGKLSMRADAMLAELRKAGGQYQWRGDGMDGKMAELWIKYKGLEGSASFSMDDAKKANLIKSGSAWTKTPDAMLRARATSKAMRMYAPEIVAGYYTPEEVIDFTSSDKQPAPPSKKPAGDKVPKKDEPKKQTKELTSAQKFNIKFEVRASSTGLPKDDWKGCRLDFLGAILSRDDIKSSNDISEQEFTTLEKYMKDQPDGLQDFINNFLAQSSK